MATTTNFPKISGKNKDFLEALEHSKDLRSNKKIEKITMTGTVKLHGAHFDVVVNTDNTIRLQSRNIRDLGLANDIQGFAAFMLPLSNQILALKSKHFAKFRQLNPKAKMDPNCAFILAGEWIGPGVQPGVAISKIPKKCFVITCIQINGNWLPNMPYADISDEASGIFNISRGGFYTQQFPLKGNQEGALDRMQQMANNVEAECPFAKKVFGISGLGEGIVWKAEWPLCAKPKFWIKMKGPISNGTYVPNTTHGSMKDFVIANISEQRMTQAMDHLKEMGYAKEKGNMSVFTDWIREDIQQEEKAGISVWGMDKGGPNEKFLKGGIDDIAGKWYLRQISEPSNNPTASLPKPGPNENMREYARKFAATCVTVGKLEETFKRMQEKLKRKLVRGDVSQFINLVVKEGVFKDERKEVDARGLGKGKNKEFLEEAVENIAGNWFFNRV